MQIRIETIKENDDGSADMSVHYDQEALAVLVQEGLVAIIEKFIAENKNAQAGIKMREEMKNEHTKSK